MHWYHDPTLQHRDGMDPTDSGTQQHGVRTYITCKNVAKSRLEGSSIYITDMPEVRYRYVALSVYACR